MGSVAGKEHQSGAGSVRLKTLGGAICIRNGIELDYCLPQALGSLLPICDEVVICDCESTDGTRESLDKLDDPKVKIISYEWTNPVNDPTWYVSWVNHARSHLQTDHSIYLDADEVLHENSHLDVLMAAEEGKTLKCQRFNFWRDPQHLIPKGKCLGTEVIRVGPTKFWMPSDYPDKRCQEAMDAAVDSKVGIYHYGFLRERGAFFRKAKAVQSIWAGGYDPRIEKAETFDGYWGDMPGLCDWNHQLEDFGGTHPEIIKPWLEKRGYKLS